MSEKQIILNALRICKFRSILLKWSIDHLALKVLRVIIIYHSQLKALCSCSVGVYLSFTVT